MRYAAYIEIDGENRLEELKDALQSAVYELVKNEEPMPGFSVDAYAVPSMDEWQAGHKNTMTAVDTRSVRTGMKL